jgi:tRNA-2-methylthio-N6-dimethylallyladenosine synthase
MTYFFETYGCQMNIAESASVERAFIEAGWTKADDVQVADFVIINTCSVRETAESRILGRLGWYASLKAVRKLEERAKNHVFPKAHSYALTNKENPPRLNLAIMGCMAERLIDSLQKDYPVLDYVIGNFQKQYFPDIIAAVEKGEKWIETDEKTHYVFAESSYEKGSHSAFVPIMHGCNNFCSYCIVPYVRGREVSRSPESIFAEIDALSKNGVKEITFLGQNVNSYIWEEEGKEAIDFPSLMQAVSQHIHATKSSIGWIRFMSSHPKDISPDLIQLVKKDPLFCKHIHLPVQHGSNAILDAMRRKYTREAYLEKIAAIKKEIPGVSLSTDIMIGFPGETIEDFEETIALMREVAFENAFMYYYNPREGTKAADMQEQLSIKEKKRRLALVIAEQQAISKRLMEERLGESVRVLAEGFSKDNPEELVGRTERDERVVFPAGPEKIGCFVEVFLTELTGATLRGKIV